MRFKIVTSLCLAVLLMAGDLAWAEEPVNNDNTDASDSANINAEVNTNEAVNLNTNINEAVNINEPPANLNSNTTETKTDDTAAVAKQLKVRQPIILPTNPFYGLKSWWENLRLKLTFNKVNLEQLRLQNMNERLVEIKALTEAPADPTSAAAIAKTVAAYQAESKKFQDEVTSLKDKIANNPKLQAFLQKSFNQQLQQQAVLKNIQTETGLQQEVEKQIASATTKSSSNLSDLVQALSSGNSLQADFSPLINETDLFTQLSGLDTLNTVAKNASADTKANITQVENKTLAVIQAKLQKLDEQSLKDLWLKFLQSGPSTVVVNKITALGEVGKKMNQMLQRQKAADNAILIQKKSAKDALQDTTDLFEKE